MHRTKGFVSASAVAGVCLAIIASSAWPASANHRPHARVHPRHPSNFDYLVLASMADSPHLLAMASYYRTAAPQPQR